jgi:hypothetical protein
MQMWGVRLRSSMLRNIRYITDSDGKRLAVILPLNDYRELLESMDVIPSEKRSGDARRPASEVIAELIVNGKLD